MTADFEVAYQRTGHNKHGSSELGRKDKQLLAYAARRAILPLLDDGQNACDMHSTQYKG